MLQNKLDRSPADALSATFAEKELQEFAAIKAARVSEALLLYEPQSFQQEFHSSTIRTLLMRKGNQVGGEQPYTSCVVTPQGKTTMGALDVGDVILGGDGLPCVVEGVQEYGDSPVYRFTFSDGATCEAGENHKWTCRLGARTTWPADAHVDSQGWKVHTTKEIVAFVDKWGYTFGNCRGSGHHRICFPTTTSQFAPREVPIDPYTLGVLIGDGNFTHRAISVTSEDEELVGAMSVPDGCRVAKMSNQSTTVGKYGKASLYGIAGTRWHSNPMADGLRALGLHGKRGHEKFIPECYIHNSVDVRLGVLQGLMDTDGNCGRVGCATFYTTSQRLADDVVDLVQSLGGCASVDWRANSHRGKPGKPLAHISISLPPEMNPFRLSRKRDRRTAAMKHKFRGFRYLRKVEYVGVKPCRCIKVGNQSLTYLTDNYIVTHNTLCGAVEVARAVTGQDPYNKYPKKDGVFACLGYGEKHIGNVFFQKLFCPGAFSIIRDLATREWRAFRPWPAAKGGDLERESEKMKAPPLIPERFVDDIAWEKKNERIFNVVRFTTGWELRAYNSAGDPGQAQGFQCHGYWLDEDLANSGWIAEILFRLIATRGYLRWTALPHGKNDEMLRILDDAEQQLEEGKKEPTTKVISVTTYDNKFLDSRSVEETVAAAKAQGEDVYEQRIMGKLSIGSTLMYQSFSKRIHTACRTDEPRLEIHKILEERNGQPPEDWCRYTSTDPGHGVACTLFLATPPPELGDFVVAYREVYLRGATAEAWGDAIEPHHQGHHFQSFLFDEHGGRLTEIGSGKRPRDYYTDQLRQRRIKSESTGYNFMAGSDHIAGREEALREWLSIRRDGYPKLLIVIGACPMLVWEMERFRKKTIKHSGKDIATDVGNRKVNTHAIENLEMLAAHGCPYVKPAYKPVTTSHVEYVIAARKHRELKRRSLAPGASNYIPLTPLGR